MRKEYFKTNTLLKDIIGKDLIVNDNIAVLELVKNSFDSNSEKVNAIFKNVKKNDDSIIKTYSNESSKIIIKDFGVGMGEDDIIQKWLNIAYSDKKNKKVEFDRVLAGSKGIGRFSCDRLGEFLDIYTRKRKSEPIHVKINWKDFEIDDPEKIIQHVPVYLEKMKNGVFEKSMGFKRNESGTVIEISKLRSKWDADKLLKLKDYLERLLNPNQKFTKKKFVINIEAEEFKEEDKENGIKINGPVENKIFKKLGFRTSLIESSISRDGKYIYTTIKDRNRTILKMKEKNHYNLLNDIKVIIHYLNPYAKAYFKRKTGIESVNFGSIFLFRNGFRIPPYGDKGDDWLGMEIRKAQGTKRYLSTRDVMGRIEINDPGNRFKEVSSREGLIGDETFRQITNRSRGYFIKTLKRLEEYVVHGLKWDSVPIDIREMLKGNIIPENEVFKNTEEEKEKKTIEIINKIIGINAKITGLYINTDLIDAISDEKEEKIQEILSGFRKYDSKIIDKKTLMSLKKIEDLLERKEGELKHARKLIERTVKENFFLKSITAKDTREIIGLQHHIGISTTTIENHLKQIRMMVERGEEIKNEDLLLFIDKIAVENKKISSIVKFVMQTNFELIKKDSKKRDIVYFIKQYIENVFRKYRDVRMNYEYVDINFKSEKGIEFKCKFNPFEIIMVIDNLLNNSLKANAKKIQVIANKLDDGSLEIIFKDDGRGIKNEILDKIFDLGYTTTSGTGVGLYHSKQIVNNMNGDMEANNSLKRGVEFIIKLKK